MLDGPAGACELNLNIMRRVRLGHSDIEVSAICLGTMVMRGRREAGAGRGEDSNGIAVVVIVSA
jgi:aryl-alcohol dehydrogenase-like predicted oxidoreductase